MSRISNAIPSASATTTILIVGLRNNCCREIVTKALEVIPGVRHVQVSLYRASAMVVHQPHCKAKDLVAAIKRTGYSASLHKQSTRSVLRKPVDR